MDRLGRLVRVRSVDCLTGFAIRLEFEDSTSRAVDIETVAWANGADIDPDVLYYDLTPAWMQVEPEPVE
jgi:hypothetical protein